MKIKEIINSLNLIYYEFDKNKNMLIKDTNYTNKYTKLEFFKITYYLTKKNIIFNVLKDKTIQILDSKFVAKSHFSTFFDNLKNSQKNIFLLNDKKVKWAKNIPLFKIVYKKRTLNLKNYDALIFTSKNAINAIESMNKDWKKIPSYVISEQTAKLVKNLDGNLEYFSKTRHGDEFAYEICDKLKAKKVLYIRGKEIISDLIDILENNDVICDDEIVYENQFNKEVKKKRIPKNSKIIFTSPSTIKYFFKVFSWNDSYTAISIGKTTAKYFPKNIKPIISENTSFKACVDKALSLS